MCVMKKVLLILLLALSGIALFPSQNAFAGAWTVPKYKLWGEYNFKWQWAKDEFTAEQGKKRKPKGARSWELIMEPKLEFGIRDWLNLLWSLEYKAAQKASRHHQLHSS